jgi:hypothetical protein
MQQPPPSAKDPTAGFMLSMLLPGLGFAYAGNPRSFLTFLLVEGFLWFAFGMTVPLVIVHFFQAVAAAGAVKQWNQSNAGGPGADIPPPPAAGTRRARTAPATALPAAASAPRAAAQARAPLDADGFLAALQDAWREYRAGGITARQFADRKFQAIRGVRVDHGEEGEALVAAAQELENGGVLTSEDVAQIRARVLLQ